MTQKVISIPPKVINDNRKKVVLVGDTGCGKTEILYRAQNKVRDLAYPTTSVTISIIRIGDIELSVVDTSGQTKFMSVNSVFYKYCDVFVVVYDACNQHFMESLDMWIDATLCCSANAEIFIVCNKINAVNERETIENGRQYANRNHYHFIETSAFDGTNIQKLFTEIAQNG